MGSVKDLSIHLKTTNKIYEFRANWEIENFLLHPCTLENELIESPSFSSIRMKSDIQWMVRVYPRANDGFVMIQLVLLFLPTHVEKVNASVEFSIIDSKGDRANTAKCDHRLYTRMMTRDFPLFISRETLKDRAEELLHAGSLKLQCFIQATLKFTAQGQPKTDVPLFKAEDVLNEIYELQICSDVMLNTKGKKFKCHKSVLSARSTFFRALFSHDLKENLNNVVDLSEEMNEMELADMISYIYTGKTNNLGDTCYTLCHVADVYDLPDLRVMCENELLQRVSADSAFELLTYAEKNGTTALRKAAAECIATTQAVITIPTRK